MKTFLLLAGAIAGTIAAPVSSMDCSLAGLVVDDSNLDAITGKYHVDCTGGVYSNLSTRFNLLQNGVDVGGAQVQDHPNPSGISSLDGVARFPAGLVHSADGVKVCLTFHANDATGVVTPEHSGLCFGGPQSNAAEQRAKEVADITANVIQNLNANSQSSGG